jgi:hypothetical protein
MIQNSMQKNQLPAKREWGRGVFLSNSPFTMKSLANAMQS